MMGNLLISTSPGPPKTSKKGELIFISTPPCKTKVTKSKKNCEDDSNDDDDDDDHDDDDDDLDENIFEEFLAVRMDLTKIFLKGF